mgnify:CR=1 FL=1
MHDVPAIDRSILVRSVPLCFSDRHRFLLFSDRVSKLWRPTKDVEGSSSVRLRLFLLFVHVRPFLPASLLSFYLFSFFFLPLPPSRNLEVDARPFLRSFVTSINLDNDQSILLLAFCGVPWLNRDPRRNRRIPRSLLSLVISFDVPRFNHLPSLPLCLLLFSLFLLSNEIREIRLR